MSRLRVPEGENEKREFFDDGCAELLQRVLPRVPDERFDAVIVDEGQDFRPGWWPVATATPPSEARAFLGVLGSAPEHLQG